MRCFSLAAALDTCYRRHEATKAFASRYSDGDLVLAGSSFHYNSPILIANGNDFPRPFFIELQQVALGTLSRHMPMRVQLLMPNIAFFNTTIKQYY